MSEETIKRDVGAVILSLEAPCRRTDARRPLTPGPVAGAATMSDPEREAALALLRDPQPLDRILDRLRARGSWAKRRTSSWAIWPPCRGSWMSRWRSWSSQFDRGR